MKPGRECKCGEWRMERMVFDRRKEDNHTTICRRCHDARRSLRLAQRTFTCVECEGTFPRPVKNARAPIECEPCAAERVAEGRVRVDRVCECGQDQIEMIVKYRMTIDGHLSLCKKCHASGQAARNEANRDDEERRERGNAARRAAAKRLSERSEAEILARQRELHPDGTKRCYVCKLTLPLASFYSLSRVSDGLRSKCKACYSNKGRKRAAAEWWQELGIDPSRCIYCWKRAEIIHVDHVFPVRRRGKDTAHNYSPACPECNLTKNARPVTDWLATKKVVPFSDALATVLAFARWSEAVAAGRVVIKKKAADG